MPTFVHFVGTHISKYTILYNGISLDTYQCNNPVKCAWKYRIDLLMTIKGNLTYTTLFSNALNNSPEEKKRNKHGKEKQKLNGKTKKKLQRKKSVCCCVLEGKPRALSPFSVDSSNPRSEFLPPPFATLASLTQTTHGKQRQNTRDRTFS